MAGLRNLKHEAFAQQYARRLVHKRGHASVRESYSQVYDCQPDSARASGGRLLAKATVQQRIFELISSRNAPEELAADLAKLRRAKRGVYHQGKKVATEPDHGTRLQAVETCLKAQGAFKPEAVVGVDARSINFSFPNDPQRLEQIVRQLEELNRQLSLDDDVQRGTQSEPSHSADGKDG